MNHSLSINGLAFRLRPVKRDDAPLIIELRTNPNLSKFLHRTSGNLQEQLKWMDSYFNREFDYYFAIERLSDNSTEGFVGLYDINDHEKCGEWGRWILREGSLAAAESAWLIYRTGFELLKLDRIFCRTNAENSKVISFHDSYEAENRGIVRNCFTIDGVKKDAVEHQLVATSANDPLAKLESYAKRVQRFIK